MLHPEVIRCLQLKGLKMHDLKIGGKSNHAQWFLNLVFHQGGQILLVAETYYSCSFAW